MKKILALILIVAMLAAVGFVACGGDASSSEASSESSSESEMDYPDIATIFTSELGDKSFNDSCWAGLTTIKEEYGIELAYFEAKNDLAKYIPALQDYIAEDKYELIITGTWSTTELAGEVANDNPDVTFIHYDATIHGDGVIDNAYSCGYAQNELSYMTGTVAGLVTETGVIGFVGGGEIDVIKDFAWGYVQAATEMGGIEVSVSYIGNWDDIDRAKNLTREAISLGSDVNYQVAGGAGLGLFEACAEAGVWGIGVDSDQWAVFKDDQQELADAILTSGEKRVGNSMILAYDRFLDGTLALGTHETLGVAEGTVGVSRTGNFLDLDAEIIAALDAVKQDIIDGKIEVGTAFGKESTEQDAFIKSLLP